MVFHRLEAHAGGKEPFSVGCFFVFSKMQFNEIDFENPLFLRMNSMFLNFSRNFVHQISVTIPEWKLVVSFALDTASIFSLVSLNQIGYEIRLRIPVAFPRIWSSRPFCQTSFLLLSDRIQMLSPFWKRRLVIPTYKTRWRICGELRMHQAGRQTDSALPFSLEMWHIWWRPILISVHDWMDKWYSWAGTGNWLYLWNTLMTNCD